MNTKGHIITDEQFDEYEKLKKADEESTWMGYIALYHFDRHDWYLQDDYKIIVKSDVKEVLYEIIKKIDEVCLKSYNDLRNHVSDQVEPLDARKRTLYGELSYLEEKKRLLMQSPTVWEFLKQRKLRYNRKPST
jgi:hypothetical protein